MECDTRIPPSRRPIAVEDDQAGDESSYSVSPLVTPVGITLSDTDKAKALADSLETQFQPVTDPSVPVVIEMIDVGLRSYLMAPASKHKLTNPEEVQEAIRDLKVSKAPGLAWPSQSQAKVLTGGGDLREAQVDVPLSVSHSCV